MNWWQHDHDDFLPGMGWRLLIQLGDALTKTDAREQLVSIFGEKKAFAAEIVPGTRTWDISRRCWHKSERGYRAYLPVNHDQLKQFSSPVLSQGGFR